MMIYSMLAGLRRSVHSRINDGFVRRLSKKLQLDDEQQTKLAILQSAVKTTQVGMVELRHDSHRVLGELLAKNDFDRNKAVRIMHDLARQIDAHTGLLVDSFSEFFASLDCVQKERLRLIWQTNQSRHMRRWH